MFVNAVNGWHGGGPSALAAGERSRAVGSFRGPPNAAASNMISRRQVGLR